MLEIIFLLVFAAMLLVTGVTMMTILGATVFALIVMFLMGMLGVVLKLLPWIIVIALGIWFFKHVVAEPKRRHNNRY